VGLSGAALILTGPSLLPAVTARSSAEAGQALARSALTDIRNGNAPATAATLRTAEADLAAAHAKTDAWWTWGGDLVPIVAQQHRAIADLTGSGQRLAGTGATEVEHVDLRAFRASQGQVNLAAVQALRLPLQDLSNQISSALAVARRTRSGWLIPELSDPIARLSTDLSKAQASVSLALEATRDAPDLLGADRVRHYLVVFMTPAEARGLGGFLGAYAELSADQGRITLIRTGRPVDLETSADPPTLKAPADYVARYGAFRPQDHVEDVGYSPDFPTVTSVLAGLYPQLGGDHIDGVLALDPYALAALLRFTGPISIPGFPTPLDQYSAADVLLRQQYLVATPNGEAGRHDLLQAALSVGFQRLTHISLPSPSDVGAALGPVVQQGRLMFWSTSASSHPLLQQLGLTGAFPTISPHSKDLFAFTLANAANNKIDAYLYQDAEDRVTFDPADGAVTAEATLRLHNTASTGLPPYVIGSFGGSGLPAGTNLTWLSIYSPLELTSATVDGKPLRMGSGVSELGVTAYSAFVPIPAMSEVVVQLSFRGRVQPGPSFMTTVRTQPLSNPTRTSISLAVTAGWQVATPSTTWTAGSQEIQSHEWKIRKSAK
jgi:hypothetical protein